MPRRISAVETTPAPVIHPHAVYTADQLRALLGVTRRMVRTEVREGRLRVSRRGRYYFLGQWIVEWIEGGELSRKKQIPAT